MHDIRPGERWHIRVGDEIRLVQVIASAATGGWWQCLDIETEIMFSARNAWFVSKEESAEGSAG